MADRILEVNDLQVAFHGKPVVHGVNLHIDRGESLALVGESGSGKSVTALSVPQLLPYPQASHPRGSVLLDGVEMIGASKATLLKMRGNRVSMIFQEPMTSLNPLHTIGRQVGEVLVVHQRMGRDAVQARTLELLDVGLDPGDKERYPHEFSGGQRQRIAIARAMILKPDFIVLDEPTSALDMSVQAQVVDLLRDLQRRHDLSYLFISHDLKVVRALAHELIVMKDGVIVEQGRAADIFDAPQQDYTRALLAAAFDLEVIADAS